MCGEGAGAEQEPTAETGQGCRAVQRCVPGGPAQGSGVGVVEQR